MTTIGQMPKPEAERFREDRKLLLVPLLIPFPRPAGGGAANPRQVLDGG